jgi:hypothetical protein
MSRCFFYSKSTAEITAYLKLLVDRFVKLNPILIYLAQPDVRETISRVSDARADKHGDGFFMVNESRVDLSAIGGTKVARNGWSEEFTKAFLTPDTPFEPLIDEYNDIPWTKREELL